MCVCFFFCSHQPLTLSLRLAKFTATDVGADIELRPSADGVRWVATFRMSATCDLAGCLRA